MLTEPADVPAIEQTLETLQRRNWWGLVAIPATFCIGVSCGLPLYLALRR